jgi:hypothetical protein
MRSEDDMHRNVRECQSLLQFLSRCLRAAHLHVGVWAAGRLLTGGRRHGARPAGGRIRTEHEVTLSLLLMN